MKINTLVLGAAGLLAATSAQAADLPVAPAPEPIDYVRICDAYGAGFFFIPGTETCLKISGDVEFETTITLNGDGSSDYGNQETSPWDATASGSVTFDARENTAWGTLRGVLGISVEQSIDDDADGEPGGAVDGIGTDSAFIEIGGFTMGYIDSAFDGVETLLAVAYTADFGNGLLATLSFEDTHAVSNGITDTVGSLSLYNGSRYPDIVGNIAYSSGIISADARGAVHWVGVRNDLYGPISDEVGFAVGATVSADLPFLAGVSVTAAANYGIGASAYACNDCGFVDAAYNGTVELVTVYQLYGELSASLTDQLSVSVDGTYGFGEVFSTEASYSNIGTGIDYSPFDNLTFSTGLDFTHTTSEADGADVDTGFDAEWSFSVTRSF